MLLHSPHIDQYPLVLERSPSYPSRHDNMSQSHVDRSVIDVDVLMEY